MKQLLKYIHIAVLCAVVIMALGGYFVCKLVSERTADAPTFAVQKALALPKIFSCDEVAETSAVETLTESAQMVLPEYADRLAANADFAGMLCIDGITLLPVMHSPTVPEFYLDHLFDKTMNKHGTIFIDGRCEFNPKSENIIMYGHNMRDKSMFSPLMNYKSEDFYREHPIISFDTLYEKGEYEVFAAFAENLDGVTADPKDFFNAINFRNEEEFGEFAAQLSGKSLYKTEVTPSFGDTFITLMTCTNADETERMTVVAVKN